MTAAQAAAVPQLDIDPFDDAFLADPYAFHAMLRDAGPVVWLTRYGIYAAARHAEVGAALSDWQRFVSGRGVGLTDFAREAPWRPPSLLLEADPPLHERTRGIMKEVMSLRALQALMPAWREKAAALVDTLVARGRIEAIADLAAAFPLLVFPDAVGLPAGGEAHLMDYAALSFNAFGPRNAVLADSERRARDAVAWVDRACRRENLAPGAWGAQVYAAADAGRCTEDEAHRLVRSLLTAGLDTTVNGIANMLHAFARHPAQWDRLRAEPGLRKRAFEEALRWDSTVQLFCRTTIAPTDFAGTRLPEGAKIILFLAAANRDPRRWHDPDAFDIGRVASGHMGFGFGIHQCLGQMMARFEADAVLEALMERVAAIRIAGTVERRLNNSLHAIARLPLDFTPGQGAAGHEVQS